MTLDVDVTTPPTLGLALPTRIADAPGPRPTLDLLDACLDAAGGEAAVVLVACHHGPGAGLQSLPLAMRMLARLDGTSIAPLFIAPAWPPTLLAEQMGSLAAIAETDGAAAVAVIAAGHAVTPVVASEANPTVDRGRAVDLVFAALIDAGVETWVAGERGRGLERAASSDGWVANAVYDHRELSDQLAVTGSVRVRALRRDVLCREDPTEARAEAHRILENGYRPGMRPEHLVLGDADDCARQLADYADLGFTHVLLRPMEATPDAAGACVDGVFRATRALASAT